MTSSVNPQTNFLVAVKLSGKWKKVGITSYQGTSFNGCDYELPDDICQAIDKACRRYFEANDLRDIIFELSMYPDCEFRVTAYS